LLSCPGRSSRGERLKGKEALPTPLPRKGEEQPAPEPKRRAKKAAEPGREAQRETGAPRRRSKRAQIIALMQGVTGATLNDMVEASARCPKTTRQRRARLTKNS
jgi:hypothetical protein